VSTGDLWSRFDQDPRDPSVAALRASDRDRAVVLDVLTEAYAEGRLDREEYDERAATLMDTKTLGALPSLIADLRPLLPATRSAGVPVSIEAEAVAKYHKDVREAVWAFVSASLITWAIWFVLNLSDGHWDPSFPWPVFVMIGTGVPIGKLVFLRSDAIEERRRKLEKKQTKRLEGGQA
jgi:hypothetical protein